MSDAHVMTAVAAGDRGVVMEDPAVSRSLLRMVGKTAADVRQLSTLHALSPVRTALSAGWHAAHWRALYSTLQPWVERLRVVMYVKGINARTARAAADPTAELHPTNELYKLVVGPTDVVPYATATTVAWHKGQLTSLGIVGAPRRLDMLPVDMVHTSTGALWDPTAEMGLLASSLVGWRLWWTVAQLIRDRGPAAADQYKAVPTPVGYYPVYENDLPQQTNAAVEVETRILDENVQFIEGPTEWYAPCEVFDQPQSRPVCIRAGTLGHTTTPPVDGTCLDLLGWHWYA